MLLATPRADVLKDSRDNYLLIFAVAQRKLDNKKPNLVDPLLAKNDQTTKVYAQRALTTRRSFSDYRFAVRTACSTASKQTKRNADSSREC